MLIRGALHLLLGLAASLPLACGDPAAPTEERPSFLLVVIDTLRADAVSAYGEVEGTTPYLDALAQEGLRFTRAMAPSPWTLPSHATLFTGVGPEQHGVGIDGRTQLPEHLVTLAERLSSAGYETIGFSENMLVSKPFGLARGFSHFEGELSAFYTRLNGYPNAFYELAPGVSKWASQRDAKRPFLAFVNILDPHHPYEMDETGRFLPPNTDPKWARRLGTGRFGEGVADVAGICDRIPPPRDLAILHGLYLGDVATADAELASIHQSVAEATRTRPLVTIVTSDHGEHLGERRLLGHQFSLGEAVLHIPLVVQGLPDVSPAVVDAPVALEDIAPSILAWAGLEVPEELPGRVLPTLPSGQAEERELLAFWNDTPRLKAPGGYKIFDEGLAERRRAFCGANDRVFGDLLSLIRFPYKLVWFERHSPELYDLSWDPEERSDVASHHPERVARMAEVLERRHRELDRISFEEPELDPRAEQALRALGYID
jgi:arylsulfatase A-like enzyme